MIFKRRDKQSYIQILVNFIYPKGGWSRAAQYVKLRLRRLPDSPEKISRGIAAGVFASFSPFYGLHFIVAAFAAKVARGNVFAALLGTFFGNPLTYIPIGVSSLYTGYFLLSRPFDQHKILQGTPQNDMCGLACQFGSALYDLWSNLWALLSLQSFDFSNFQVFWQDVFFPYLIGGAVFGFFVSCLSYAVSTPLLRAYQKRNKKRLQKKLARLSKPPINKI